VLVARPAVAGVGQAACAVATGGAAP
jgi:hypothetical protein